MDGLFPLADVDGEHLSRATISACGEYRYTLDRVWDASLPIALFVMLNPSVADASVNDKTILKCTMYAKREGYGGLTVVNLFALRSTDPRLLTQHPAPVGADNDAWITVALGSKPAVVICAWGAHPAAPERAVRVLQILAAHDVPVKCLGTTQKGHPRHPLYLPNAQPLIDFDPWKAAA